MHGGTLQGVDDADTSVLHGNLGVRGHRPPAACGGPGRSTTRTGVLQGSPGALRARRWAPLGGVDLRADGDRRRADTDVRHQPAATGCASPKAHRSAERAHSVGRHDVGGGHLGHDRQLAGSHARRGVRSTNRSTSSSRGSYCQRTGGSERTSGFRRWTVLVAPRMARARTGAAGIRRAARAGRSRGAGLPPGSSHAISGQSRKRARPLHH